MDEQQGENIEVEVEVVDEVDEVDEVNETEEVDESDLNVNMGFNWTNINTVLEGGDVTPVSEKNSAIELAKQWYINRMTDDELRNRMDMLNWGEGIADEDRLQQFKEAISGLRGSTITCVEPIEGSVGSIDYTLTGDQISAWNDDGGCDGSNFGPKRIIPAEYEEWSADYLQNVEPVEPVSMSGDFGVWGSNLLPPNHEFENCVNNLLNEYDNDHDSKIIDEIREAQEQGDITLLHDEHIRFIKRKLQMLLMNNSRQNLLACIHEHMLLDTTICEAGLTEQMYFILNVLFSVIGFQFNLDELDDSDNAKKDKLIMIIDELGDLIPRSLERIVDMSEELEIEQCGGRVSNKTMVIKDLYSKIFKAGTTTVEFDTGLSDLVSKSSDTEFNRSSIIAALGIAFLKYF